MVSINMFGYRINAAGLASDVAEALSWVKNRKVVRYLAAANPHSLVVASKDLVFQAALQQAYILYPDGTGILIASMVLNTSLAVMEKFAAVS